MMKTPKIVDNDRDEITARLDGKEIRGWSYANETERRVKMLAAHEFAEGWFRAMREPDLQQALADVEEFLQGRADAEYFPDSAIPVPNEAMRLLVDLTPFLEEAK